MNTPSKIERFGQSIPMQISKRLALVAHDNEKSLMLEWAGYNQGILSLHHLFATGTTGRLLEQKLKLPVKKWMSGPLGGDQQIGALIAQREIDMVVFWDPLEPQPHDPDVKALLRLTVVWNIPVACNRASADFVISSPLMATPYERQLQERSMYTTRDFSDAVSA